MRSRIILIILSMMLCMLFMIQNVSADSTDGTAYAVLTDAGELILFRSTETYSDGDNTVTDINGDSYTGHVYTGIETTNVSGTGNSPWYSQRSSIKSVRVASGQTIKPVNCYYWFYNCSNCTSMDLAGLDTGNVTNMQSMFSGCSKLTSLDLRNFNTSKVTNMQSMFYNCSGLTSLDITFNTGNVTNMGGMFSGCRDLTALNLINFDTANVTDMGGMFNRCSGLTSLDLSNFNTANVTNMQSMFSGCSKLTSLDFSNFNTSKVTNMQSMFSGCSGLTSLTLSNSFNTSKVTTMWSMFHGCSGLTSLDLSHFNTAKVTDMESMFCYCSGLTSLNLSNFNTANVTNMDSMFSGCSSLANLDLSNINTANVTNMDRMFSGCSGLTALNLSHFVTENVMYMQYMFYGCSGLTSLDITFNTGNVTNMDSMFAGCSHLIGLNLSSFNTGNVTNMSEMFRDCISLTSLDLSSFDTENVMTMHRMFSGCRDLTSLDLSSFDTANVTDMRYMFSLCYQLSSVILGQDFSFKGKNITDTYYQALLPDPPSAYDSAYTGKWIRDDKAYGPYSSEGLRDNYLSDKAGKWIWEIDSESAIIIFDANGGFVEPQSISQTVPFSAVEFPLATRLTYNHVSWTLNRNGTGDLYLPGHEYNLFDKGNSITLYAQWEKLFCYTVNHYQQKLSLDGYDLFETEQIYTPDETVEVSYRRYDGYIDPEPQTITVATDNSSVVNYYYDRTQYIVHYDANGGTGSIPDQQMIGDYAVKLMDNRFEREGYWFTGWNTNSDGTGTSYGDVQTVNNLANNGETINLYAQWAEVYHPQISTDGKYTVELKKGETVTISNIPAGTHYTIKEINNPNGWKESSQTLTDSVIQSNRISSSRIINTYSASGSVQICAYKVFDGELHAGDFNFQLLQNGSVIQTKKNGEIDLQEEIPDSNGNAIKNPYYGMSKIVFDDISFNTAGNYTYTIREVNDQAEGIEYDNHVETITVHVTDNHDGTLSCVPEYDQDGPVFTNTRIPVIADIEKTGKLSIGKIVSNKNTNDQFDFNVSLTDANGIQINNPYPYDIVKTQGKDNYRSVEIIDYTAVSHTQNIDDEGNKNSNYGNSWGNSNIRGTGREDSASSNAHVITIPGVESLHVRITYGGESASWDWACVWEGSHPEYTAYNSSSSISGKLGGGNSTSASNTKEYDIPGDSVTFSFKSDSSGIGDGYGYYAVVTGQITKNEYTDDYISSGIVSSGQTFELKHNQTMVIKDIPEGIQYTIEELPKAGYELVDSSNTKGTIDSTLPSEAIFTNIYNGRGNAQIHLQKEYTGGTLQGGEFTFELLDSNSQILQTTTNNANGEITFNEIPYTLADVGKRFMYTVREVEGNDAHIEYDPELQTIIVDVTDNGDGTFNTPITYMGDGVFTNRKLFDVPIRKVDITGNSLSGAALTVTGTTSYGKTIEPLTLTTAAETIKLPLGTYTLHESAVPNNNYLIAEDIVFTVTENGIKINNETVDSVTMTDDDSTHEIPIRKTDILGNRIEADLTLTGTTRGGSVIEPISITTSTLADSTVSLKPGTYTLHEVQSPDSTIYARAENIEFTVTQTGTIEVDSNEIQEVVMVDPYIPHDVEIEKVSSAGIQIVGASMQLTGIETGETDITPISWQTTAETKTLSLKPGEYTLTELTSPTGFLTADPITFTVEPNGTLKINNETVEKVSMTDAYDTSGTLTLSKTVKADTIDTEKVFDFVVTITDKASDLDTTNWKIGDTVLTVTQETRNNQTNYTFTIPMKHGETKTITGLHIGSTYTVAESEQSAQGYVAYGTNSTGTIANDTSASYENVWLGILPATGFFNMNNMTVRIAIIIAIAGLIVIALYPKKKKMNRK